MSERFKSGGAKLIAYDANMKAVDGADVIVVVKLFPQTVFDANK